MTPPMSDTMTTHPETRLAPELLPCPFCGGPASLRDGMGEFWVKCADCGSSGTMRSRRDRAERDWNDRPAALASSGDHADHIGEAAEKVSLDRVESDLRHCIAVAAQSQDGWRPVWEDALTALLAENAALRSRATEAERKLAEAVDAGCKLSAAISWTDYPFIDNNTTREEIISRLGYMQKDAEQPRAFLAKASKETGE